MDNDKLTQMRNKFQGATNEKTITYVSCERFARCCIAEDRFCKTFFIIDPSSRL